MQNLSFMGQENIAGKQNTYGELVATCFGMFHAAILVLGSFWCAHKQLCVENGGEEVAFRAVIRSRYKSCKRELS